MNGSPSPRRRLAALGLAPSKSRGQNFLRDPNIIEKIARTALSLSPEAAGLVEIGPGLGALTEALLAHEAGSGRPFWAVEFDRGLAENLRTGLARRLQLTVLGQDVLTLDPAPLAAQAGGRLLVCGNLPYSLSSPILFWLLKHLASVQAALFMLQKEMVERLTAPVGHKDYGRLTVALGLWFMVEKVMAVPPAAFHPRPRVDSAVVSLVPRPAEQWPPVTPEILGRFTAKCFAARRKTLINNLAGPYGRERALAVLTDLGLEPGRRAETLAPETLAKLARRLAG